MKKENLRTIFSFHLHRCLIIIGLLCAKQFLIYKDLTTT